MLGNWYVDPFGWISDKLNDLIRGLATVFELWIIRPMRMPSGSMADYLSANSWFLAVNLAYLVFIMVLCFATFRPSFGSNVLEALLVLVLIGAGAALFDGLIAEAIKLGDRLAVVAFYYTPTQGPNAEYLATPQIVNPIGAAFGAAGVLAWGALDAITAITYGIIAMVFKILLPLAIVMKPLGKRGNGFFHLVIALGIVVIIFGRPVMIFTIETSKWIADSFLSGNNVFVQSALIIGGLAWGFLLQIVLFIAAYKSVIAVEGRIKARVNGSLNSVNARLLHPTQKGRESAHQRAFIQDGKSAQAARMHNAKVAGAAGAASVGAGAGGRALGKAAAAAGTASVVVRGVPIPHAQAAATGLKVASVGAGMVSAHYARKAI